MPNRPETAAVRALQIGNALPEPLRLRIPPLRSGIEKRGMRETKAAIELTLANPEQALKTHNYPLRNSEAAFKSANKFSGGVP